MPRRTNEYQELVALIERTLAPKGAKVAESVEVEVPGLTRAREIDVLMESPFGPYTIKIAVEAKDEGRVLDVTEIEALAAKYRGECAIHVDKVVIVSRSGFSKGAQEKAKALDIELLTLDEAKDTNWSDVGPRTCTFRKPPHICGIYFLPLIQVPNPSNLWNHAHLICPHGHDHGTPMARAKCLVFHKFFPSNPDVAKNFQEQVERSPGGEGILKGSWPHKGFKLRYHGEDHDISSMAIHIHYISQTGESKHTIFKRQSSRGDSRLLHEIQMVAGGMELSLMIPHGTAPPPKIGMRLRRLGTPANSKGHKKGKQDGRKRKK